MNICASCFNSSLYDTAPKVNGLGTSVFKNNVAANPAMLQEKREYMLAVCEIEVALPPGDIFTDECVSELNAFFVDWMICISTEGQKANEACPDEIPLNESFFWRIGCLIAELAKLAPSGGFKQSLFAGVKPVRRGQRENLQICKGASESWRHTRHLKPTKLRAIRSKRHVKLTQT